MKRTLIVFATLVAIVFVSDQVLSLIHI